MRRGIVVVLLDDLTAGDDLADSLPPIDDESAARLAAELAPVAAGTVQVRRLPPGRRRALTVVVDAPGSHYRIELGSTLKDDEPANPAAPM